MKNNSAIYILDSNQNSREILKSYLLELGIDCEIKIFGDYKYALQEIKKTLLAPIVFFDI